MKVFHQARIALSGVILLTSAAFAQQQVDDVVLGGVRWGDSIEQISKQFGKLEADLCRREDKNYYKAMKWSCEGVMRPHHQVLGLEFDVKFRLSDDFYGLANVNLLGRVRDTGEQTGFVEACANLTGALEASFGVGRRTSDIVSPEVVRRIVLWESPRKSALVTLACLKTPGVDYGELMINVDPIERLARHFDGDKQ